MIFQLSLPHKFSNLHSSLYSISIIMKCKIKKVKQLTIENVNVGLFSNFNVENTILLFSVNNLDLVAVTILPASENNLSLLACVVGILSCYCSQHWKSFTVCFLPIYNISLSGKRPFGEINMYFFIQAGIKRQLFLLCHVPQRFVKEFH